MPQLKIESLTIVKSTVISFFIVLLCYHQHSLAQTNYLWPINDSDRYGKFLTSAFAEYRSDRFHAGIDIKTVWADGHKAVAVGDGSLYRLSVSSTGYGRAMYIRLKDGKIAVYAHLRGFEPKYQELVDEEQERQQKFFVDLWYSPGAIPVERGEILATTGRSAVRLQHLHFELRDSDNRPINPLANGFAVDDQAAPRPTKISIRPLNIDSHVDGDWQPVIKQLNTGNNGVFVINDAISVWGGIGMSVDAFDRNGTYENNYGIYSLKLIVGGKEQFSANYENYCYDQNRLINLDRDFRLLRRDKGKFQKLYVDYGNTLPFYGKYRQGDGILYFNESTAGKVPFEIVVGDYSGNVTSIKGIFDTRQYEPIPLFPADGSSLTGAKTGSKDSQTEDKPPARFRVAQDFQDNYLRLTFTANRDLVELPKAAVEEENSGISTHDLVRQLEVRAKSRRSFVAAVPLADIENRTVHIHIIGESSTHRYESEIPVKVYKIPGKGKTIQLNTDGLPVQEHGFVSVGALSIVQGDLFKDLWLRFSVEPPKDQGGDYDIVSNVVHLEPKEVFLRSNVQITLKYPPDEPMPEKLGIYAQDNSDVWHYIGSTLNTSNTTIMTRLSSLETISLIRDTIPPEIYRISPENGIAQTNKKPEITAWFDDSLSGIAGEDSMELFLDGEKLIAEWDAILKKIFFVPKQNLTLGEHAVRFVVKDRMNNTTERTWTFTVR